jgi:APA family basic amino acid/polyamine antiporter
LGLWDAISVVIGIIIGAGIFKTPADVFQTVSGPWEAMGVWALGGILSVMGALCFAELASTYPRSGGEYVYLSRAYDSWMGFLFAWSQLAVVRTGAGIGAMAYVFADFGRGLWGAGPGSEVVWASSAIIVLSFINILGVNPGKRTQNLLTLAKVVGLGGIIVAGFFWSKTRVAPGEPFGSSASSLATAMIFVLFTYDGWNEAANVTTEVRDGRRNLPLALILGTLAVTVIYLAVNAAFLIGLGWETARTSKAVPADVLELALGERGSQVMSLLVVVSALGSLNGTIFTGSRIYRELGTDHGLFAALGNWNRQLGTPVASLVIQAGISLAMVVGVASWWDPALGFEALVAWTAPVFWLFFLLSGISLFVLRWRDRAIERPFRVPLFPWLPLSFCGSCAYMLYSSVAYVGMNALITFAVVAAGAPLFWISRRRFRHFETGAADRFVGR